MRELIDGGIRGISVIEQVEEADELAQPVPLLDARMHLASQQVDPGEQAQCRLYSGSRAKPSCSPGFGGKPGAVLAIAWMPGFSS
jgi:hypothetical protein